MIFDDIGKAVVAIVGALGALDLVIMFLGYMSAILQGNVDGALQVAMDWFSAAIVAEVKFAMVVAVVGGLYQTVKSAFS